MKNVGPVVAALALLVSAGLPSSTVRAEELPAPSLIRKIEYHAETGELYIDVTGWRCSSIRSYVLVAPNTGQRDQVLSIAMAAYLARRPVQLHFTRTTSGNECRLDVISLE